MTSMWADESAFAPKESEAAVWADESAFGVDPIQRDAGAGIKILKSLARTFGKPLEGPTQASPRDLFIAEERKPLPKYTPEHWGETHGGAVTGRAQGRWDRRTVPEIKGDVTDLPAIAVGTAAQVSDMFTSTGRMLLGAAPYWGARAVTKLQGARNEESAAAAQAAKDYFFPPEISTPWGRVAESLGPEAAKVYHNNPVAWIMGKIGDVVSKGAEGISKENPNIAANDVMSLMDQFMGSLIHAQIIRPKVAEAWKARKAQFDAWQQAKIPAPASTEGLASTIKEPAPEPGTAEAPFRHEMPWEPATINQELTVAAAKNRTKRGKDIKAAFKDVDMLEQLKLRANETMEGKAAALVAEAEKTGRTVGAADWADIAKDAYEISQKPGAFRTPEEMIRLREYNRRAFADQAGKVDPEMLPFILAATAAGTVGGLEVYRYLNYLQNEKALAADEDKLERIRMRGLYHEDGGKVPDSTWPGKRIWAEALTGAAAIGAVRAAAGGKGNYWDPSVISIEGKTFNTRGQAPLHPYEIPRGPVDLNLGIDPIKWAKENPELAKGTAAVAAGAATGAAVQAYRDGDITHGALLGGIAGALLGTPKGRASLQDVGKSADYTLGLVSTRYRHISEPFLRRARQLEGAILTRPHELIQRGDPFLVALNKIPEAERSVISRALWSGNDKLALSTLRKVAPEMGPALLEARAVIKEVGAELKETGVLSRLREDYGFPRVVADVEGLLKAVNKELRTRLDSKLLAEEKRSMKLQGRPLNEVEKSTIINEEMRKAPPTSGRPGFTRERGIEEITPELERFYEPLTASFHTYIKNAITEIEKAKFFGRDAVRVKQGNASYIDVDTSIGNVVRREFEAGRITQDQIKELSSMLRSRFTTGEQGARGWIQDVRNLSYVGMLGNVYSAASQLGDVLIVPFHTDLRGTVSALAQGILGKQRILARDYGLVDHLSEEFVSTRKTAKVLNSTFKWSTFTGVDLLGKNTLLNSALDMYERLAQTTKGQARLFREYGRAFEEDFPQLVKDLQEKKLTPLVKEVLFYKLSDAQPITRIEVPQAYLDMPNGKVVYMLRTFMLKQIDIARLRVVDEIAKGTREGIATGMKNAVAYGTLLGLSGATTDMVKDWMLGRPFDPRWEDVALNALKTFGWTEYTLKMAQEGHTVRALGNIAAPPWQMLDDIVSDSPKALNYLPLVGKLIYPHTEAGELAEAKRARKLEQRDDPEYQEKQARLRELKHERMKDPAWREYYLERAKGGKPQRPVQ